MAKFLQATYPCTTEMTDFTIATGADTIATILNKLIPPTTRKKKTKLLRNVFHKQQTHLANI